MATTALAAIAPTVAVAQSAGAQQGREFDIPSQSLPQALMIFGRQAGLQVTAEGPLTEGKTSAAVKGNLAAGQALSNLLSGTGLTFRFVGRGGVHIERAPEAVSGAVQLGPVRVEGDSGVGNGGEYVSATSDPIATEGTGSYTTPQVSIMKGAESLKDIPQSISVITRQRIEDQNLLSLRQVMDQTPGIYSNAYFNYGGQSDSAASYFSRGFEISSYMVDGVPANALGGAYQTDVNYGISGSTAIYDRIEVLRGAAGLLVGSGNPGGTVNLVRKRPTKEFQQQYILSAGSWNNYRGEMDLSGPLTNSGNLRARIVGAYESRERFWAYTSSKSPLLYGTIDYDISPSTRVSVGGRYEKYDESASKQSVFFASTFTPNRKSFYNPAWGWRGYEDQQVFSDVNHNFNDDWKLSIAASHLYEESESVAPRIRTANDIAGEILLVYGHRTKTNSIDANVIGKFRAFGMDHKLTFGFNLSNQRNSFINAGNLNFNSYPIGSQNPTTNWLLDDAMQAIVTERLGRARNLIKSDAQGFFGKVDFNINKNISAIFGGRISWYNYDYYNVAGVYQQASSGDVKGNFTPYVGMIYKISSDWSLYASYADIFRPQWGYYTRGGSLIDHEVGQNYEFGIKGELLGGRLNASAAIYQVDLKNSAQLDTPPYDAACDGNPSGGSCYVNTGKRRTRGFDAEITGELLPNWQVSVGYTYTDTEILKIDATWAGDSTGFAFSLTPRHMLKAFSSYAITDRLTIGGGVQAQSKETATSVGYPVQQGYSLWNSFVKYRLFDKTELSVQVNNIFDKTYWANGTAYLKSMYGEPRSFMATLRAKF